MSVLDFIKRTNLDNSLLLGFYGGGNYGDELLMEVLAGLLKKEQVRNVRIAYQTPQSYSTFHHNFGYPRVPIYNKLALTRAILQHRNIVVGGGGLWGMDVNLNVFLMSCMLLFARIFLRKNVYLLAVGYYASAPRLGRISAWLAGKAATTIIARDTETYKNFIRLQRHTEQSEDIAWSIKQLDLAPYKKDLQLLEQKITITKQTIFITLRHFKNATKNNLEQVVAECLKANADKPIIIALMEPRYVDPHNYALLEKWRADYRNVQILDFDFNPLALFLFFRAHHKQLLFVGPQFHVILSAHLTGVPYMPMAYDNKVQGLLAQLKPDQTTYPVHSLRLPDVQHFIDNIYQRAL
jgi:polysaccharide pyruvyl transferase WcaK-like protein